MAFSPYKYIRQYLEKNKEQVKHLRNKELAEFLFKNDSFISQHYANRFNSLKSTLSQIQKQKPNVKVKDNSPKPIKTSFSVVGDKYHFHPLKGEFVLPVELVDELFYSFSKHGLDLTTTEILNNFNLEPHQWHAIKSALNLYKASNIFSPHTVDQTDPEALKIAIRAKMDQRVNTLGHTVVTEYNNSIITKYKEVIKQKTRRDLEMKTMVSELFEILPKARINARVLKTEVPKKKIINISIADLHFGASNPKNPHLPSYSVQLLKEKFEKEIIPTINSYNASEVNIFGIGDWIESATGFNHPDSWKGIQEGMYGAKVITDCYKFLIEVISQINNVKRVIGVAGNHDRMTPNKDHDREGFAAELIFEFLKVTYEKTPVEIIYNSKLNNIVIDNICYILSHGHEKYTDHGFQLVLKYGSQRHFNVLLSGHWHERRIAKDNEFFRQIVCPSIFPGNNFSQSLGFSTNPGFLVLFNNGNGKLAVHDYSI